MIRSSREHALPLCSRDTIPARPDRLHRAQSPLSADFPPMWRRRSSRLEEKHGCPSIRAMLSHRHVTPRRGLLNIGEVAEHGHPAESPPCPGDSRTMGGGPWACRGVRPSRAPTWNSPAAASVRGGHPRPRVCKWSSDTPPSTRISPILEGICRTRVAGKALAMGSAQVQDLYPPSPESSDQPGFHAIHGRCDICS